MHAIAQANITMSLSETKPTKNMFLHPGSTRLAYLTTLTSWCFLLKQVVGSIMASHPRFPPSSTSSSSKCPPRPRASRDQHPPCRSPFLSSAVRSIILTRGRNNIGQPPPTHLVPIHTLPLLYKHDAPAACKSSPKSVFAKRSRGLLKAQEGALGPPPWPSPVFSYTQVPLSSRQSVLQTHLASQDLSSLRADHEGKQLD